MPVTSDATALVALGKVDRIDLLASLGTEFFISPWVRQRELRAIADQIDTAMARKWLHEVTPSRSVVDALIQATELDQGEVESIVVAGQLSRGNMQLLLDEGRAFQWVQQRQRRPPNFHLVCLGQILHQVEDAGGIASAAALMQELLDSHSYRWASSVRRHYEVWCRQRSILPLPETPRS